MNNQDQAAEVIRTWQQRHKNVMDSNPDWAAQNLAGDLHNAGLITPDLPEPSRGMTAPHGKVWYLPGPIGDIRRMGEHIVIFGHDYNEQSFRLVLNEAEADTIARTILAAARHQEGSNA